MKMYQQCFQSKIKLLEKRIFNKKLIIICSMLNDYLLLLRFLNVRNKNI